MQPDRRTQVLNTTTAHGIEGTIRIRVSVDSARITAVQVESSRRTNACHILEGRPFEEALQAMPLLFSVCGVAQAGAAVAACEQARGIAAGARERARRRILVGAEMVQEHAGQLLMDWPVQFLAAPRQIEDLVVVRRHVSGLWHALGNRIQLSARECAPLDLAGADQQLSCLEAALARSIFGMPATAWMQIRDYAMLQEWWRRTPTTAAHTLQAVADGGLADLGRSGVGNLPPIAAEALCEILDGAQAERFSACPTWNGETWETGPLARQTGRQLVSELRRRHGNGLMTRLVARLTELAVQLRRMQRYLGVVRGGGAGRLASGDDDASAVQSGTGIVETARGRLVHRVRLRDGVVERYRIVAPTEWNFHPDGPLVRAIRALPAAGAAELRRQVAMLVMALDPCVAHEVIVEPALAEDA